MSIQQPRTDVIRTVQQDGAAPAVLTNSRHYWEVALFSDEIGLPDNGDTVTVEEYHRLVENHLTRNP